MRERRRGGVGVFVSNAFLYGLLLPPHCPVLWPRGWLHLQHSKLAVERADTSPGRDGSTLDDSSVHLTQALDLNRN